ELLNLIERGWLEQDRAQHRGFCVQVVRRDAPGRGRELRHRTLCGRGVRPEAHGALTSPGKRAGFEGLHRLGMECRWVPFQTRAPNGEDGPAELRSAGGGGASPRNEEPRLTKRDRCS